MDGADRWRLLVLLLHPALRCLAYPLAMGFALVGVLTGLSLVSPFIGLIPILPIVGHAAWHP